MAANINPALFDRPRVTRELQACGFDASQAAGIVAAIATSLESTGATQADAVADRSEHSADKHKTNRVPEEQLYQLRQRLLWR